MTDTITLPRATVQQVLEALEDWWGSFPDFRSLHDKVAIAALRTALEQQQAEPVQKPPYPGWKPGCQVCGVHGVTGYVCPRSDCPTKVTCGGVV